MAKIYSLNKKVCKMTTIFDVAKYFLSLVDEASGSFITHLKLQKLCYYAQAWYLAFYGEQLFPEKFQAWAHGPVNADLYQEYKSFGYHPIMMQEKIDCPTLGDSEKELLDEVWRAYGHFDAKYLEGLTHQERPWIEARIGCLPGDRCDNEISVESMKEYYSSLTTGNEE